MEAVAIVTILALMQYKYFGFKVGAAHGKYGIKVPAMTGDSQFERINRVHQNTLEQLVALIPALWLYAHFVNPLWGAGMGVVYLIDGLSIARRIRKTQHPGRLALCCRSCRVR